MPNRDGFRCCALLNKSEEINFKLVLKLKHTHGGGRERERERGRERNSQYLLMSSRGRMEQLYPRTEFIKKVGQLE